MTQERTISEAALEILQANRKDKDAKQDKFGEGEKLRDTANKGAQDIGNAGIEKYTVNAPAAVPPGQTPPVGAEEFGGADPKDKALVAKYKTQPALSGIANTKTAQLPTKKGVNEDDEDEDDDDIVNEDIEALMAGENLSDEFKRKATSIFEAAVKTKVTELAEELEAQYIDQFEEAYEEMSEDFANKVDDYLDYVVENWMTENQLAVESGLRTEIAEGFINSLKTVFEEHYIEIPEEKFDVVEELASKVEALEKQVNEEMTRNIDLKQKLSEQKKVEALHSVCEGLTLSQSEKLKTIAESVDFVSQTDFVSQMVGIKESYFSTSTVKPASIGSLDDAITLNEDSSKEKIIDPIMAAYAHGISKSILK